MGEEDNDEETLFMAWSRLILYCITAPDRLYLR
jgi:hypothetical protein